MQGNIITIQKPPHGDFVRVTIDMKRNDYLSLLISLDGKETIIKDAEETIEEIPQPE